MITARGTLRAAVRTSVLLAGPALLACVALGALVPRAGVGLRGAVAALGHQHPIALWVGVFLAFSAAASHWWPARSSGGAASTLFTVALAGTLALALRAILVEPYRVTSTSMLPTLAVDDYLAADKRPRAPRRGEIVTFAASVAGGAAHAGGADLVVKRVIGLPGDRIWMKGGAPIINDWPVPSCDAGEYLYVLDGLGHAVHGRLHVEFLDDATYLVVHSGAARSGEPYVVGPGEVFVLGDNRGNSVDSRSWNEGRGGGAPISEIEARVRWFLVGTHRSGEPDWGRLLDPVDALQSRLRLEGIRTAPLDEGVARCLASRPSETHPPAPASVLDARRAARGTL